MVSHITNEVNGERSVNDKITALKNIAKSYEMKLKGYKLSSNNEKYEISGRALAPEDIITASTGILGSYTEYSNLITTKHPDKFAYESADAFFKVNVMLLNHDGLKSENYRTVLKMFKDSMSNVGDIICGSRSFMEKIVHKEEPKEEDFN